MNRSSIGCKVEFNGDGAEQEALAVCLLEEIHSDRRWVEAFARSDDVLARLADDALTEYRSGQTEVLDPETL